MKRTKAKARPTAVQLRDTQRRCRARHRDFVESLQQRIQAFEERGVHATKEVQQAAQKVAVENAGLRAFLNHKGTPEVEVNDFLRSHLDIYSSTIASPRTPGFHRQHALPTVNGPRLRVHTSISETSPESHENHSNDSARVGERNSPSHLSHRPSENNLSTPYNDSHPPLNQPAMIQHSKEGKEHVELSTADRHHSKDYGGYKEGYLLGTSRSPPSGSADDRSLHLAFTTPCEEAITIIASMRGQVDKDQVRFELGCGGPIECHIKNTALFQIMDAH